MRISRGTAEFCLGANVLTKAHVVFDDLSAHLSDEASNAGLSGHLAYYLLYNHCSRLGQAMAGTQLSGSPGEASDPETRQHNWRCVATELAQLGHGNYPQVATAGNADATDDFIAMCLEDVARFCGASDTKVPSKRVKMVREDIDRARAKAEQRDVDRKQQEERERRQREKDDHLRQKAVSNLDVDSKRLSLEYRPLPASLKEAPNRHVALFCHDIVMDVVDYVISGDARHDLEEAYLQKQQLRKSMEERRVGGRRLVDAPTAVRVPRHADHRLVLFCKDIVIGIVKEALRDDILEVLVERDHRRAIDRHIVHSMYSRFEEERIAAEEAEGGMLPLKMRKEQERVAKMEEDEDLQAEKDRRMAMWREQNRERAIAAKAVKDEEEALKQRVEELEKLKKKRLAEQNKARLDKAKDEIWRRKVTKCVGSEEAPRLAVLKDEKEARRVLYSHIAATKAVRAKLAAAAAEPEGEPVPLSKSSTGTGAPSAYFGDTLPQQYLTGPEAAFLDAVHAVREVPGLMTKDLQAYRKRFVNKVSHLHSAPPPADASQRGRRNTREDGGGEPDDEDDDGGDAAASPPGSPTGAPQAEIQRQPLLTMEGTFAVDEAVKAMEKVTKVSPAVGAVSIGLTLAARQHAVDLAYHGIANTTQHVGSDGSTAAQRVARYRAEAPLVSGTHELVVGVVRPAQMRVAPQDFLVLAACEDGVERKESRARLFGTGELYKSVGVGHAIARDDDRVVEIFVVIWTAPYRDKAVSHLSRAHIEAVSALAPPFLLSKRAVHPSVTRNALLATTNNVVGRTAPPPSLERLTRDIRSPSRRKPKNAVTPPPATTGSQPDGDKGPTRVTSGDTAARKLPPLQHRPVAVTRASPPRKQPASPPRRDGFGTDPTATSTRTTGQRATPPPMDAEKLRQRGPPSPARSGTDTANRRASPAARSNNGTAPRNASTSTAQRASPGAASGGGGAADSASPRRASPNARAAVTIQKNVRGADARAKAREKADQEWVKKQQRKSASDLQMEDEAALTIQRFRKSNLVRAETKAKVTNNFAMNLVLELTDAAVVRVHKAGLLVEWKTRIRKLYEANCPDKLPFFDMTMAQYRGREQLFLQALVEKFGPEPEYTAYLSRRLALLGRQEQVRDALIANAGEEGDYFWQVDRLVMRCLRVAARWRVFVLRRRKARGETTDGNAALMGMVVAQHEGASRAVAGATDSTYRGRLTRFYQKYVPDKLSQVDAVLRKYEGVEEDLFSALVEKYGPEPATDDAATAPAAGGDGADGAPDKHAAYAARLTRFYEQYVPSKLPQVETVLAKYEGIEEDLFSALVQKYGAEPGKEEVPMDDSDDDADAGV